MDAVPALRRGRGGLYTPLYPGDKKKDFFATSATVGGLYGEETVTFQLPDLFQYSNNFSTLFVLV
ncbi:hypothetical protein M5E88_18505 [Akkermansia muciniphila]|nr:hypothetical protein M5E88_18505 [Akkermansia muciniphila]